MIPSIPSSPGLPSAFPASSRSRHTPSPPRAEPPDARRTPGMHLSPAPGGRTRGRSAPGDNQIQSAPQEFSQAGPAAGPPLPTSTFGSFPLAASDELDELGELSEKPAVDSSADRQRLASSLGDADDGPAWRLQQPCLQEVGLGPPYPVVEQSLSAAGVHFLAIGIGQLQTIAAAAYASRTLCSAPSLRASSSGRMNS